MQVGPYRTLDELGRGGMGVVYRAEDAAGRTVALKVLLPHGAAQPSVRQRFLHELSALSKLRHPHLVRLLAAGEHEGTPWLALELVDGQSLEQRLRQGPLPVAEAVRLTAQLASAVAYLHDCGVIHRDLKPANVLLRAGEALLTDFGLVLDDEDFGRTRLTRTGVFLGTPGYWAPEQARGDKHEQGPHTDLYGLGAVLYACLVGRPPVAGESLVDFLESQRFQRIEAPHVLRPEVPPWLSALCLACLDPEPAGRPASARELAQRLHRGAAASPQEVAPPPWRALALVLPLTALAVAGAVGVALRGGGGRAPAPSSPAVVSGDSAKAPSVTPPTAAPPEAGAATSGVESPALPAALAQVVRVLAEGRFTEAEALAEEACRNFPAAPRAHHLLARSLWRQGRRADAERAVQRALELQPDFSRALLLRARLRGGREDLEGGLADLDRAIELDPQLDDAYEVRGYFLSMLGRYADALPDLRRATERPGVLRREVTWTTYGVALREAGRLDEAEVAFGRALELVPTLNQAQGNRAALRLRMGNPTAALKDIDAVLARSPTDGGSHALRGQVLRALGRQADALEALERAETAGAPADPRARASLLDALGRYPEADALVERLLRARPDDLEALALRMRLARAQGQGERLAPTLRRMVDGELLSPLTFREVLETSTQTEAMARAYRNCVSAAAQFDPTPRWVFDYAGRAALFLGELDVARERYAEALAATSDPSASAELHLWLALTDALVDDLPTAQASAERALRAAPPATPLGWECALWLAGLGRPAPLRELLRAETPAPPGVAELAQAVLSEGPVDAPQVYAALETPLQRAQAATFLALRAERQGDLELARQRYREARAYPNRTERPRAWAELRLGEWGE